MNSRSRLNNGNKNQVDINIGKRLKVLRILHNVTQGDVAAKMGVSFQQIQKYETGKSRMSASRLWDLSRAFNKDVGFFFQPMDDRMDENINHEETELNIDSEILEFLSSYSKIKNKNVRDAVKSLMASVGKNKPS